MTNTALAIHGGQPVRSQPWPNWPQWDETERAGLLAVLERGVWGGYDTAVEEFESAFAARHGAQHCVTTVNGTTTLETALRALEIGPGDEVIVPPYTFIATAGAVRTVGATPVFADVDLDTWNLSIPCRRRRRQRTHQGSNPRPLRRPAPSISTACCRSLSSTVSTSSKTRPTPTAAAGTATPSAPWELSVHSAFKPARI